MLRIKGLICSIVIVGMALVISSSVSAQPKDEDLNFDSEEYGSYGEMFKEFENDIVDLEKDLDEEAQAPVSRQKRESVSLPPTKVEMYEGEREESFKDLSFAAPKKWRGDGRIVSVKEKKMMLSTGDIIFTSLGEEKVQAGTKCAVFRKIKKMKDPDTGKFMGYEVRHLGYVEIAGNVKERASVAVITNSREPIRLGDILEIVEE
ncbi:hypothetical protein ACFL58_01925 [Elusimicrobiota bacterium]